MVFNAYGQAAAIFVFVYGGALVGMAVQRLQPQHHRNDDSKETVKLVMGLLATMTALILGLAPFNATVRGVFLVGGLSVFAAMLLLLSMSHPYSGLMPLTDAPLRAAVAQVGG
jgi:hypothetical protein